MACRQLRRRRLKLAKNPFEAPGEQQVKARDGFIGRNDRVRLAIDRVVMLLETAHVGEITVNIQRVNLGTVTRTFLLFR